MIETSLPRHETTRKRGCRRPARRLLELLLPTLPGPATTHLRGSPRRRLLARTGFQRILFRAALAHYLSRRVFLAYTFFLFSFSFSLDFWGGVCGVWFALGLGLDLVWNRMGCNGGGGMMNIISLPPPILLCFGIAYVGLGMFWSRLSFFFIWPVLCWMVSCWLFSSLS